MVIYALGREYANKFKEKKITKGDRHYMQYMERRLREIYPRRGHDGMMEEGYRESLAYLNSAARDGDKTAQRLLVGIPQSDLARARTASIPSARAVPSAQNATAPLSPTGQREALPPPDCIEDEPCGGSSSDPYVADPSWNDQSDDEWPLYADGYVPTVAEEAQYTSATPTEVQQMEYIEELAATGGIDKWALTLEDASGPYAARGTASSGGGWVVAVGAAVVAVGIVGGYVYWRATQSANRAYARSEDYYGYQGEVGTQRDAFRHMYVNVMLRRYITKTLAALIMTRRENGAENPPRDKEMDLHNNYLGRTVRYDYFRGHWLWDRYDWEKWGRNVRSFTNDTGRNQELISNWAVDPGPSSQQAESRQDLVATNRYIVYR